MTAPVAPPTADCPTRRVRPGDGARIRALRLEMLADSPLAFIETLEQAAARPHDEILTLTVKNSVGFDTAQFVTEADGRFVATAVGIPSPTEPDSTMVVSVYVTPTYRSRGVLGEIIDALAEWSRAAGRPRLVLNIVDGNERAAAAYLKLGFRPNGERPRHPTIPVLGETTMDRPA